MAARKLADWQVLDMLRRWDSGDWTLGELAEAYGVDNVTIRRYTSRTAARAKRLSANPVLPPDGLRFATPNGRLRVEVSSDFGHDTPADPWRPQRNTRFGRGNASRNKQARSQAPQ